MGVEGGDEVAPLAEKGEPAAAEDESPGVQRGGAGEVALALVPRDEEDEVVKGGELGTVRVELRAERREERGEGRQSAGTDEPGGVRLRQQRGHLRFAHLRRVLEVGGEESSQQISERANQRAEVRAVARAAGGRRGTANPADGIRGRRPRHRARSTTRATRTADDDSAPPRDDRCGDDVDGGARVSAPLAGKIKFSP